MTTPIDWTVTAAGAQARIDKALATALADQDITRSQIQKWIKEGRVTAAGQPVNAKAKLAEGTVVTVTPSAPAPIAAEPEDIPLDIVYEDHDVIVVNKPQGMVVHPAPGHHHGTLVNALLAHGQLATINGAIRPGIVHRIDKDTSGLLMVAKNDKAQQSLTAQLKAHKNARKYLAIVHGVIHEDQGTIDAPIARNPKDRKKMAVVVDGREAVTHFKVLRRFRHYTYIQAVLETGRTHQIRVHMAYIGHPVAGDPLYGPAKTLPGAGQFLHAATLSLTQPTTGEELTFSAEPPENFREMLKWLAENDD
ncbi:RluA family pseudouridine synthase [Schleiferilactobacillus harbinensis]|uniref:RluA family pseudouridine synthase n=1 Tax=Schleiferilactobacillus harbinensis TaxID=304207 RepID=UPI0011750F04|nr:RluA family pseudouridine synthase [Schleiferilactobacillus harbinensis]GEK04784.1 pseudouridine synthase [Schleiferilactobacillus harbinensis]